MTPATMITPVVGLIAKAPPVFPAVIANVCAALDVGVGRFDASLGGIGGCPYAPGASGNVTTEDLAFMLASMGYMTGLDVERLLELRGRVANWLSDETLHGTLWRAGLPKTFHVEHARGAR